MAEIQDDPFQRRERPAFVDRSYLIGLLRRSFGHLPDDILPAWAEYLEKVGVVVRAGDAYSLPGQPSALLELPEVAWRTLHSAILKYGSSPSCPRILKNLLRVFSVGGAGSVSQGTGNPNGIMPPLHDYARDLQDLRWKRPEHIKSLEGFGAHAVRIFELIEREAQVCLDAQAVKAQPVAVSSEQIQRQRWETEGVDFAEAMARYGRSCDEVRTVRLNPINAMPLAVWQEDTQLGGAAIVPFKHEEHYARYVLGIAAANERIAEQARAWWAWWETTQLNPSEAGHAPLVPPRIEEALRVAARQRAWGHGPQAEGEAERRTAAVPTVLNPDHPVAANADGVSAADAHSGWHGNADLQAAATAPANVPVVPSKGRGRLLRGWAAILAEFGLENVRKHQVQMKRLSRRRGGPITWDGNQPMALSEAVKDWLARLGPEAAPGADDATDVDAELNHPAEMTERGFQVKARPNNQGSLSKRSGHE